MRIRPHLALALTSLLVVTACTKKQTPPAEPATTAAPTPAEQAADMHGAHATDVPTASPAATLAPAQPVAGESVTYATLDGRDVVGYLSRPAEGDEDLPGLIVIHEWWGLNDNIRAMTDRLAGEGYLALAVDLFGGTVATTPDQASGLYQAALSDLPAVQANLRAAHAFLSQRGTPRIGSIGWCFGGGVSLEAAKVLGTDLRSAVIYYGSVAGDEARLADIQASTLGIFAGQDQAIPLDSVRAFEKAMFDAGRQLELHVYEQADHAFANPSGQSYDATAAEDAWEKTREFLRRTLQRSDA